VTIAPESVPQRAEPVVVHHDGAMVEVVVERSNDTFVLNDTAFALWELCDGDTTVREMVDAVTVLFAAPDDQLEHDVTAALDHLLSAGLISLPGASVHGA
jgi:hypothetical protein